MFETAVESAAAHAVQQLTAAREQLAGLDPAALSRDELLELLDTLETDTRRPPPGPGWPPTWGRGGR
jgi:hypothetical protein